MVEGSGSVFASTERMVVTWCMNKTGGGSSMNKVMLLVMALVFGLATAVSAQVPVDKAPAAEKKTVK